MTVNVQRESQEPMIAGNTDDTGKIEKTLEEADLTGIENGNGKMA